VNWERYAMKISLERTIFAECQQFYLEDSCTDDLPEWLDGCEIHRLLAVKEESISIGTITDSLVRVYLEFSDAAPYDEDLSTWDQVNECTLQIPSGRIALREVGDRSDDGNILVDIGAYRARIYYGKLGVPPESGWKPQEHYKIVVWKGVSAPIRVIKCRVCQGTCLSEAALETDAIQ
jgi:hypothetical protein